MLQNFGTALSREQMKMVMGGEEPISTIGGGGSCKTQYELSCSVNGGGNSEDQCCTGYKCEINGTGTGTICM